MSPAERERWTLRRYRVTHDVERSVRYVRQFPRRAFRGRNARCLVDASQRWEDPACIGLRPQEEKCSRSFPRQSKLEADTCGRTPETEDRAERWSGNRRAYPVGCRHCQDGPLAPDQESRLWSRDESTRSLRFGIATLLPWRPRGN